MPIRLTLLIFAVLLSAPQRADAAPFGTVSIGGGIAQILVANSGPGPVDTVVNGDTIGTTPSGGGRSQFFHPAGQLNIVVRQGPNQVAAQSVNLGNNQFVSFIIEVNGQVAISQGQF